jgi:hypothetical protein
MLASRTVTGLASLAVVLVPLVGLHLVVGILLKGREDVLVASLAGVGADVFRRLIVFGGWSWSARFILGAP